MTSYLDSLTKNAHSRCSIILLAGQLSHLLSEVQYLINQVTGDAVIFRVIDCPEQLLIYNTETVDKHAAALTVSELLDSCPTQWTTDVDSRSHLGAKKSACLENSQVWLWFVFF